MFYEKILRPLLFLLEPEHAHELAMMALQHTPLWVLKMAAGSVPEKPCEVFGVRFPNRIGLAAGFDKNAVALPAWAALGFGFIEAGTITAKAQPGNPRPRVFRLPAQQGLINRFGFNNDGADAVAQRMAALKASGRWPRVPVGMNLGKSKVTPLEEAVDDYLHSFGRLVEFADYVALNVSSPNTPGLRQLQGRAALDALLGAVQAKNAGRKPLLLKIAPDLTFSQIDEILALTETHRLAGIIATNTTIDHSSVPEALRETGGLSGRPVAARSTEVVRYLTTHGKLPVIAVGGIFDEASAKEKFDAGAALVQVYTGYIYCGPGMIRKLARV